MKKYLAILVTLMMILSLAAGCTKQGAKSEGSTTDAAAATEAAVATEAPAEPVVKELTWARAYDSTSLDPAESADDESNNIVSYTTEGLIRLINGEVIPGIAETWDVSADGMTYTFHLRDSVWSDGTPLTANDFAFSFFRLIDPALGHSQASTGYNVLNAQEYAEGTKTAADVGYKALDDKTLEITFKAPGLGNLYSLNSNGFHPVQQAFVEKAGVTYGSEKEFVLGNGPFVITEWSHENTIVLEKNPNYWNADSINITKLTGIANVANDTAVEMMLTGSIDLASFADPTYYQQLYDAGFGGVTYCNTNQFLHINMNGKTADSGRFLSNTNFRRALSYALDRSAACATVLLGQTPASRLIDPGANGINGKFVDEYPIADGAGINITADVTKAQEYLQLALTELGATIDDVPELSMLCYESQGSQTQLQAYQDMFLTTLGIKCVIDPQPIQQMIGKVYSFDYDFWLGGVSIGSMDVASADGSLAYWDMSNPDALFGYKNQAFSDLLAEAQHATDLQVRYDKIAELEKIFIDEVPDLLITWKTINVMYKEGIVITSIDKSFGADLAFADIVS